jgi:hypothetical protein
MGAVSTAGGGAMNVRITKGGQPDISNLSFVYRIASSDGVSYLRRRQKRYLGVDSVPLNSEKSFS